MKNQNMIDRQSMDVDIVCVGFGPATAGFLSRLSKDLINDDGTPKIESRIAPGMPLQIVCYERADDLSFGVSGVESKARAIKETYPNLNPDDIPLATTVKKEKILYLLDPTGASRRPWFLKIADKVIKLLSFLPCYNKYSFKLPIVPSFMNKHGGLLFSLGQFMQWVSSELMGTGMVQLWPGTPAQEPIFENKKVVGIRLMDQGVNKKGEPDIGFMPGMDIHADLTVVGDGPVGSVGQKLDEVLGTPENFERKDWAVGAKMLVELPEDTKLKPGTVFNTLGYPEPEIFGFFYVHPNRLASIGIFVPSWFDNPIRTSYRYLQHWILHPYLWQYLKGSTLKSWGAKSLQESGKRGEPHLVGDGFARIGEGSGSTNVLTNSGVDEAWKTGSLLAEAIIKLSKHNKPYTKENLQETYVELRRNSWLNKEATIAKKARDGFQKGFIQGLMGTTLTWLSHGLFSWPASSKATYERLPRVDEYYKNKLPHEEIKRIKKEAYSKGVSIHNELMNAAGWPSIPFDGKLLMSHQDALLVGGKVQAPAGFKDHVSFIYPNLCEKCDNKICIEMCSGQAITPGENGIPQFDREKCVHCGACLWNCTQVVNPETGKSNVLFEAGTGGLHSAEN